MADGEINRNGATIRIDDNGGVQVEPAEGQEVEYTGPDRGTDAIRDSLNTESLASGSLGLFDDSFTINREIIDHQTFEDDTVDMDVSLSGETVYVKGAINQEVNESFALTATFDNISTEDYEYYTHSNSGTVSYSSEPSFELIQNIIAHSFLFVINREQTSGSGGGPRRPNIERVHSNVPPGLESFVRGRLDDAIDSPGSIQLNTDEIVEGRIAIISETYE